MNYCTVLYDKDYSYRKSLTLRHGLLTEENVEAIVPPFQIEHGCAKCEVI